LHHHSRRFVLLALWLALYVVPSAHAQSAQPSAIQAPPPAAPTAEEQAQLEDARKLFEEGLAHVEVGNWVQAEQAFRRVLAVRSSPVVAYNLASALARLGRLIESAELLRAIVRDNEVEPTTRDPAQHLLSEIEPQICSLTVRVLGSTEGLSLQLDSRTLGTGELFQAISVDPGVHVVVAARGGKTLASEEVNLGGAAPLKAEVALDLREKPKPVVPDLRVSQLPSEQPAGAPPKKSSSILGSPWLWTGAGAVVLVAVGVIAVAALSGGDPELADPVSGTTDPPVIHGHVVEGGAR
jgi:hypothetical protein